MEETREQQIERLKGNKTALGLMCERDINLIKTIGHNKVEWFNDDNEWQKGGVWLYRGQWTYRISPDYKEEPESEKYLTFAIDWEKDWQGCFYNGSAYQRIGDTKVKLNCGTLYRFKHFEFDDPNGETTCGAENILLWDESDEDWDAVYPKEDQDKWITLFADRIVFERIE